jgi:hypothetical protein
MTRGRAVSAEASTGSGDAVVAELVAFAGEDDMAFHRTSPVGSPPGGVPVRRSGGDGRALVDLRA